MRLLSRRTSVPARPGVSGPARVDRRTGPLLERLRPGDVAVIDHLDLDRATAEALVDRGVAGVVNASSFLSGRYPHLGPDLLARAGVPMVDAVGPQVFSELRDGAVVRLHDGAVLVDDTPVATGSELGVAEVAALTSTARDGLSTRLASLTYNAAELLRREQGLLLHGEGIPRTRTDLAGRPVVVVARDHDHREDLRRLRPFTREQRPVLVGVDAGADALLAAGLRPDILVVGADGLAQAGTAARRGVAVSDEALRGAGEVVLHTDASGHSTGAGRLDRLGIRYQTLAASGPTADMALLLADARGAALVVTVGAHATLEELLDRQHSGQATTFLTRLLVGPRLVDARSVPTLYAGRVRLWHLLLVLLAGVVALAAAVLSTPVGQQWWSDLAGAVPDVPHWVRGLT